MSLYPNSIPDKRVREYLPVVRVVASSGCEGVSGVVGNREVHICFGGAYPVEPFTMKPGDWLVVDFGIELHGGIRILSSHSSGNVRLRFGESVSEAMGQPDQDHAMHDTVIQVPRYGMVEYGNTAFRFVRIDCVGVDNDKPVLYIPNLLAVAIYSDIPRMGAFRSSDERLNRIWDTAVYTVQLNMQDLVYDGAKRDRVPWAGDLGPETSAILSVFQDVTPLTHTFDFMREHTPLPMWMNGFITYSIWYLICQRDLYVQTGDMNYLLGQKDYLLELTRQLAVYVDPITGAEKLEGERFLDWPSSENLPGVHAGLHGLLYWGLKCSCQLLQAMEVDCREFLAILSKMEGYVPDCNGCKSAAALMTVSGHSDQRATLRQDMLKGISVFCGNYVIEALSTAESLEIVRKYWGGMLDFGATTFWEDFDLDWLKEATPIDQLPVPGKKDLHADFGSYCYKGLRHSFCHGWSSGAAAFLSKRLLGVRFLQPGGGKVQIVPDLGDLDFVEGCYPTPYGPIQVRAERGAKPVFTVPAQVEVVD